MNKPFLLFLSLVLFVVSGLFVAPETAEAAKKGSTRKIVASEGESFTISGTKIVRYGVGERWVERAVTGSGRCTDAFFRRDPAPGVQKVCSIKKVTTKVEVALIKKLTGITVKKTKDPVDTKKEEEKAPERYTLAVQKIGLGTVSSFPSGIDCGASCKVTFLEDSRIVLTAAPNPGFTFAGWRGASCTESTCSFELGGSRVVTAIFNQILVKPSDSELPKISLATPLSGASLSGTNVAVSAVATDNTGVVGVHFLLNGNKLGAEDLTAPYVFNWNTTLVANGTHTLTAVARDIAGNSTISAPVTVVVSNTLADTTNPVVSISAPANGATVLGSAVPVSAFASDNIGVAGVQFQLNGANLNAEDISAPYSFLWDTTRVSNGSYTFTAIARDASGNRTTSASHTVTVNNPVPDTTAPTVSLTAPINGSTVSGSSVAVSATASDNIGVAGVQFQLDGVNIQAVDTTSPYAIVWNTNTATNGTHTLTAIARDAAGNSSTTSTITVTVNNVVADTTAPTVSLTAPAAGASVSGSSVTVSAAASDNIGVVGVQFRLNGTNLSSEDTIAPYSVTWDTATVANGSYTLSAIARDAAGNTTTAATRSVLVANTVPDTTAPTVSLTAPTAGATVSGSATTISATATDTVGVVGVQFKLDGTNLQVEDTTSPYSITWDTTTASNGTHTLSAVARDAAGNSTTASSISITVNNVVPDTTAPTISLTSPANGATVSGTTTTVSATATDAIGVVGVQFKLDGTNLQSEDTNSPYSIVWNTNTVTNGTHTLSAVARDAAGNSTTASTVTVTVNNTVPDTTAPTVSLTAPTAGATVSGASVSITATASDNIGVAGVQFQLDGANLQAEDTTSPYSITWNTTTATNGTHTLTAIARDAAGNSTTSASRSVTVSNVAPDTTAPVVSQVTAITTPSNDTTPSYVFNTNEAGTITYAGSCTAATTTATTGNNTVTLNALTAGTYSNCTLRVTDAAGNQSNTLSIPSFTIDTTAPTITDVSSNKADGTYATGAVIDIDVTFSESVTSTGDVTVTLETGTTDRTCTFTVSNATTGTCNYTVQAGDSSTDLTVNTLAGILADQAGNTMTNFVPVSNLAASKALVIDASAPTVSLTAPAAGATISGTNVTVSATASDNIGVVGVQFRLNGSNLSLEDTVAPYSVTWDTTTTLNDTYVLTAIARDAAGNTTTAATRSVLVANTVPDTTAPTVSLTAPTAGATVSGASVSITATASDNIGVAGVQFQLDGANLQAEDTTSPYSITWNTTTATNGTHTLTAIARDAAGNSTTSASRSVTVSNVAPDTTAPVVSLTAPSGGTTISGTNTVSATATDNIGIVGVQFQLDGINLQVEDTTSPYSITWDTTTTTDGMHAITAIARDAAGNSTTSSGASVIVSNAIIAVGDRVQVASSTNIRSTPSLSGTVLGSQASGAQGTVIGGPTFADGANYWNVNFDTGADGWAWGPKIIKIGSSPSDTTAPTVSLTAPTAGATVSGASVSITATASDNIGVAGVQFQLDGANLQAEDTTSPYSITWNTTTATNGTHTLTAIARDAAGNSTTASTVTVTVNNTASDTTVPTVSLTAPAAGATVSGTVTTISATASDNVGVVGVQFKIDGANIQVEDTTSPYSITWDTTTTSNGTHTLSATARDAAGNSTTSIVIGVTVSNTMIPSGETITINPNTTYQTITGWEAMQRGWEIDKANNKYDPTYKQHSDKAMNFLVNEVGVNRIQLAIQSGWENPIDYWSQFVSGQMTYTQWTPYNYQKINDNNDPNVVDLAGYQFSAFDESVETVVLPMKSYLEARGEKLYVVMQVGDFGTSAVSTLSLAQNPAEYAEFVQVYFDRLKNKYGITADALNLINEPENTGTPPAWTGTRLGQALVAVEARLTAAGYTNIDYIAPSVTNAANAVPYTQALAAVPGALSKLKTLSYHRYALTDINSIWTYAQANGLKTAMNEYYVADYNTLINDLTVGNVSFWQKWSIGGKGVANAAGGGYINADFSADPNNPTMTFAQYVPHMSAYFKYVRFGATRIDAQSSATSRVPMAFVNLNGTNVVVIKTASGTGTKAVSLSGLRPATYGVRTVSYSGNISNQGDIVVGSGGTVTLNISDGFTTIYDKNAITPGSPPTNPLTVTRLGNGTVVSSVAGINCGNNCTQSYTVGTSVTLTATPDAGSTFTGWSGDCTGTSACVLTMNAAKNVTATFNTPSVPSGNQVTSFDLTSPTTGTNLPFTLGLAFKKGDVTGTPALDIPGQQVTVLRRWNDNSVKHAIASGHVDLTGNTAKTINVLNSTAGSGTNLTASNIQTANPQASVQLGSYGTVNLSSLLGSPFRTWVSGPEMVEAHYRSGVGSDPTLSVWFYVRLYKNGKMWIRTVVENGSLDLANATKTYVPTVSIGGTTVYNNGGSSLTHYAHTRWTQEGWIGGDPQITPQLDTVYLTDAKLVPNYFKLTPSATALNGLYQNYSPMQAGQWPPDMGGTGYAPQIGLFPLWDALYITSNADPRAYKSVLANANAINSFPIEWDDSNTKLTVRPTDRPTWTVGGAGGGGATLIGAGTLSWDIAHHGSAGYTAYLITGDYYYLETLENQSALCYLMNTSGNGSGTARIITGQTRGLGWCMRTLSQHAAIAPTGNAIGADYSALLQSNVQKLKTTKDTLGGVGTGYLYEYNVDLYGAGTVAPWQQHFLIQSLGMGSDMEPLANMSVYDEVRDWSYRGAVGILGDANGFCFNSGSIYNIKIAAGGNNNATSWYPDWQTVYTNTFAGTPPACTNTLGGTSAGAPSSASTGYWGKLIAAIAYAVDDNAPGASAAWARLTGASNWSTVTGSGFGDIPIWGVIPRAGAAPSDTTAPTVSLTAPSAGATVSGTATTISANAADTVGVAGVQFKIDGLNLDVEDTTAPYSITWNTRLATNGTHTLSAVARDAAGNSTTSSVISVTVNNVITGTNAIDSLAPLTWYEVPNSRVDTSGAMYQYPTGYYFGNSPHIRFFDESGATYDSLRDRMLVWGGGHGDYAGNEIMAFNIGTLTWSRINDPSPRFDVTGTIETSGYYPDANGNPDLQQPRSRHAYWSQTYIPQTDQYCSIGAFGLFPNGLGSNKVDCFNFATGLWTQKGTPLVQGGMTTATYDPATGRVWVMGNRTLGSGFLAEWDVATDTWTKRSMSPSGVKEKSAPALDTKRRKLAFIGVGELRVFDLTQSGMLTSQLITLQGDTDILTVERLGFAYDSVNDKYVAYSGVSTGGTRDIYIIDPVTWTSTRTTLAGSVAPAVPASLDTGGWFNGIYGRLAYIPTKNAFIFINNHVRDSVFFFKL